MTGLQNNAHAVGLACYAPMLCNVDYVNWKAESLYGHEEQFFVCFPQTIHYSF
nr:alpha-L-arabinofuranosidase C-terminal domain-containing protein [Paenibacillus borealis]